MSIVDLKILTDEGLERLQETVDAEEMRREHLLTDPAMASLLAALSDDELLKFSRQLDDEDSDRTAQYMKEQTDKTIADFEATRARNLIAPSDRHRIFVERCARLFRLANLNAPEPIIARQVQQIVKYAPKYEEGV